MHLKNAPEGESDAALLSSTGLLHEAALQQAANAAAQVRAVRLSESAAQLA